MTWFVGNLILLGVVIVLRNMWPLLVIYLLWLRAGMPISYVSNMLGHTNLTTTSRYLNINVRVLHREMEEFEAARRQSESVASALQENAKSAQAELLRVQAASGEPSSKPTVQ